MPATVLFMQALPAHFESVNTMDAKASFDAVRWRSLAPGAREKRISRSNVVLRLLEFSPPYVEHEWCTQPHVGYVVDGSFTVQFRDHAVTLAAGDGLFIAGGENNAHKAVVNGKVLLFLADATVGG